MSRVGVSIFVIQLKISHLHDLVSYELKREYTVVIKEQSNLPSFHRQLMNDHERHSLSYEQCRAV